MTELDPSGVGNSRTWWLNPFSVFQTNLQEIDTTLDVERTLDFLQDYGADTWLINVGGITSFYPTDLPFQTRSPFLARRASGDLVGDAITAAHSRGVRVIARLDFSKVASSIAQDHPQWLYVSPSGDRQVYNTLYATCPSGEYYQNRSLEVIGEILDRYPVDGFFINGYKFAERDYSRIYRGVCHCAACVAAFAAAEPGRPLPAGPEDPDYQPWLRFAADTLDKLTTRIAEHISQRRPEAALVRGGNAQLFYTEANNAFGRDFWPYATAENASAHATARPDQPVLMNSVSFVDMPYRMAGEQPELFAQYLLQGISRGARPSTYIMGEPGRIPYQHLETSRTITRFYKQHRDLYRSLTSAARVAVLRPPSGGTQNRAAGASAAAALREFRGVYSALREAHIDFDVLPLDALTRVADEGRLARYRLIAAPSVGPLGRRSAAALDSFVAAGGHLLLTGDSAIESDGSVALGSAPALMRLGPPIEGSDLWSSYVSVVPQPDAPAHRYRAPIVPVFGSYHRFLWHPDAAHQGGFLPQAPYGPPEKCFGHLVSADPARVSLRHGAGSITMIPWTVGETYYEFGTSEVRDHFLDTVTSLSPPLTGRLPEQIELAVATSDDRLVLHLINQSGMKRRSFGPHVPVTNTRLRLLGHTGFDEIRLLVAGVDAKAETDGADTTVEIPLVEQFEVVTLR